MQASDVIPHGPKRLEDIEEGIYLEHGHTIKLEVEVQEGKRVKSKSVTENNHF